MVVAPPVTPASASKRQGVAGLPQIVVFSFSRAPRDAPVQKLSAVSALSGAWAVVRPHSIPPED